MRAPLTRTTTLIYMAIVRLKGGPARAPSLLVPRKKKMTVPDLQQVVMEVYRTPSGQYKNKNIIFALFEDLKEHDIYRQYALDSYRRLPMPSGVSHDEVPEDERLRASLLVGHYLSLYIYGELHTLEMMRLDMLAYLHMCRSLMTLVVDDQWQTNPPNVFDTGIYTYFCGLCYEARVSPLRNFSLMVTKLNLSEEVAQSVHRTLTSLNYLTPSINPKRIM